MNREVTKRVLELWDTHAWMLSVDMQGRIAKHRALMEAYVNGADIEFWSDVREDFVDPVCGEPFWHPDEKYRIKPKTMCLIDLVCQCLRVINAPYLTESRLLDELYRLLYDCGSRPFQGAIEVDTTSPDVRKVLDTLESLTS